MEEFIASRQGIFEVGVLALVWVALVCSAQDRPERLRLFAVVVAWLLLISTETAFVGTLLLVVLTVMFGSAGESRNLKQSPPEPWSPLQRVVALLSIAGTICMRLVYAHEFPGGFDNENGAYLLSSLDSTSAFVHGLSNSNSLGFLWFLWQWMGGQFFSDSIVAIRFGSLVMSTLSCGLLLAVLRPYVSIVTFALAGVSWIFLPLDIEWGREVAQHGSSFCVGFMVLHSTIRFFEHPTTFRAIYLMSAMTLTSLVYPAVLILSVVPVACLAALAFLQGFRSVWLRHTVVCLLGCGAWFFVRPLLAYLYSGEFRLLPLPGSHLPSTIAGVYPQTSLLHSLEQLATLMRSIFIEYSGSDPWIHLALAGDVPSVVPRVVGVLALGGVALHKRLPRQLRQTLLFVLVAALPLYLISPDSSIRRGAAVLCPILVCAWVGFESIRIQLRWSYSWCVLAVVGLALFTAGGRMIRIMGSHVIVPPLFQIEQTLQRVVRAPDAVVLCMHVRDEATILRTLLPEFRSRGVAHISTQSIHHRFLPRAEQERALQSESLLRYLSRAARRQPFVVAVQRPVEDTKARRCFRVVRTLKRRALLRCGRIAVVRGDSRSLGSVWRCHFRGGLS